jgi:hypothetical protein
MYQVTNYLSHLRLIPHKDCLLVHPYTKGLFPSKGFKIKNLVKKNLNLFVSFEKTRLF